MKYLVFVFVLALFLDGVVAAQPLDSDNLLGQLIPAPGAK